MLLTDDQRQTIEFIEKRSSLRRGGVYEDGTLQVINSDDEIVMHVSIDGGVIAHDRDLKRLLAELSLYSQRH